MTGFPDDNVADGRFRFSDEGFEGEDEWFGHYDGVNWSSSAIKWTESGFAVTAVGDSTDMGSPDGENRYLQTFFHTGARVEIVRNADRSLILSKGELTVAAEQDQTLRSKLVGEEWVVVEMTGFPDDNVVVGNFDFTHQRFRYYDGVNHAGAIIAWNESGFTVTALGDSTTKGAPDGYPGPYLGTLVPVGARVEIVQNADGSLVLTQGDLTVVAEPA